MADETARIAVEATDNASGVLSRVGGALSNVGAIAAGVALGGVVALGAGIAKSMQTAADFESTLNRFSAVTGLAGQEIEKFNDLALKLGAETQFSAAQAADAMVELAKGGIDPATISAGGLEAALNLAAAGELELAAAAGIAAKQYGVWVSSAASAEEKAAFLAQAADRLAQAANASTVDVDELALGMANVGGVAKVAGLSFDETTQAMALLAPGFSSAADAGTSFKAFLNNMVPTSKNAKTAMFELGLMAFDTGSAIKFLSEHGIDASNFSVAQLEDAIGKVGEKAGMTKTEIGKLIASFDKSVFYDASGNFVGMEEAARLLHDATKDLTQEQKSLALETMFGSDAQRAAAIIAEQGAEGYRRMGDAMLNAGSAADQAAARNKGFNFALESLKGSIETIMIVIGQKFLPVVTQIIEQFLIPAVNWFGDLASEVDLTQAPLIDMSSVMETVQKAAGAVIDFLVAKWPTIQMTIATVFDTVSSIVTTTVIPLFERIVSVVQTVIDTFVKNWPTIQSIIEPVIGAIVEIITTVLIPAFSFIYEQAMKIVNFFIENWPLIEPPVSKVLTLIRDVVQTLLPPIVQIFKTAFEMVKTVVSTTITAVLEVIKFALKLMNMNVHDELGNVKQLFVDKFNEILGWLAKMPENFVKLGQNIINGLIDGLKARIKPLSDAFEALAADPINGLKKILDIRSPSGVTYDIGANVAQGYIDGITDNIVDVSDMFAITQPQSLATASQLSGLAGGSVAPNTLPLNAQFVVNFNVDGRTLQQEIITIVQGVLQRERLARGV